MNGLRLAPLLPFCLLGCFQGSFVSDVSFLKSHTEVVLIGERGYPAQVAICPEFQGRVMTSTARGEGGRSHGWINRELIASGGKRLHINAYGGEDRFWLGPEGGQFSLFFAPGAPFDLKHWQTPPPIDSEPFEVARRRQESVTLRKHLRVKNASGTRFEMELQREIRMITSEEAGRLLGIQPGLFIQWVGYESRNRVVNTGDKEWTAATGMPSIWILGMFPPSPSTTVVVPFHDGPEERLGPVVNDAYFGKVPADRLKIGDGVVYFKGDGQRRSKIGISPRRSKSLMGSWDDDAGVLTIVHFNQPGGVSTYVNSMWEIQKNPYDGDAIHSYNDGPTDPDAPALGAFYELESSSPALNLKPGFPYLHIHRTFHFEGRESDLDAIARRTLGVGLDAIRAAF
jgi:hypothetical protein